MVWSIRVGVYNLQTVHSSERLGQSCGHVHACHFKGKCIAILLVVRDLYARAKFITLPVKTALSSIHWSFTPQECSFFCWIETLSLISFRFCIISESRVAFRAICRVGVPTENRPPQALTFYGIACTPSLWWIHHQQWCRYPENGLNETLTAWLSGIYHLKCHKFDDFPVYMYDWDIFITVSMGSKIMKKRHF